MYLDSKDSEFKFCFSIFKLGHYESSVSFPHAYAPYKCLSEYCSNTSITVGSAFLVICLSVIRQNKSYFGRFFLKDEQHTLI